MQTVNLQKYSPPGYFDLSDNQSALTTKIFNWFEKVKNDLSNEANFFDHFYRLFLSVNYTNSDSKDFLNLIASRYGLGSLLLPANNLKNTVAYISIPRRKKLSDNIQEFIDFLFLQDCITAWGNVSIGYNSRSNFAETLIIFSNSLTLPVTPSNIDYTPLKWDSPINWAKTPLNSTYYCRGYLYEGQIVWSGPVLTSQVALYSIVSLLSDLPLYPSLYDACIVADDMSGDFQSVYYFDGFHWQKCSTPNANQGVVPTDTALKGSEVFATNDFLITSTTKPPNNDYSQGFGFYGIFGEGTLVNTISFSIVLTDVGFNNLGLLVQLMKKFKPIGNLILVYATYNSETFLINVQDTNS